MTILFDWVMGEERLWKPFWLGGVLGAFLLQLVLWPTVLLGTFGSLIWYLVFFSYYVWISVAIWNCAYNVDWEWWGHLARAAVVVNAVMIVAMIGMLILAVSMLPQMSG